MVDFEENGAVLLLSQVLNIAECIETIQQHTL